MMTVERLKRCPMARRLVGIEGSRVDLPEKRQTPSDRRRDARRIAKRVEEAATTRDRAALYGEKRVLRPHVCADLRGAAERRPVMLPREELPTYRHDPSGEQHPRRRKVRGPKSGSEMTRETRSR